jgi:thymidylate synthase
MKNNYLDSWYQALLSLLVSEDQSFNKSDRTGTGTKSLFGIQFRHNMSDGFPLLTTKKMAWKSIVTELLWFLRGETNIKFLLDYDCHIWDGDAYKNYCKFIESDANQNNKLEIVKIPESKEIFIKTIKCDDEIVRKMGRRYCENFAKQWGDLGPIYGKQWRQWQGWMQYKKDDGTTGFGSLWYDQILRLVHQLKTEPDSRRLMVSAWNVAELDKMVLPPCHYGFQVYTRELNLDERAKQHPNPNKFYDIHGSFNIGNSIENSDMLIEDRKWLHNKFDEGNIPKRAISLMWNQRSVDTFLGLPFNLASYGLLLEIIAREVNMVPDQLIGNLGDVHLYNNHIEQAKEQIGRKPFELPTVKITERNWYLHEAVKNHLGEKTFDEKIKSYRPDCFELLNYESHPKIKAPLSN